MAEITNRRRAAGRRERSNLSGERHIVNVEMSNFFILFTFG